MIYEQYFQPIGFKCGFAHLTFSSKTGIANATAAVGSGIANVATATGTGIASVATNTVDVFSSKPIENGKKIFAKYYNSGTFTGKWYPAVINSMGENGMYNIRYYDNDNTDLPINDIRVVHPRLALDKEKYFDKLYNYNLKLDELLKPPGVAMKWPDPTEEQCKKVSELVKLEKTCIDYKNEINNPEVKQYFKRENIYRYYKDINGLTSEELNKKLFGGKSRKQRKSHKNNKSRKNRKSRKDRK
jgi:hypothetical protein